MDPAPAPAASPAEPNAAASPAEPNGSPTLFVFAIHSDHLTQRSVRLHGTLQTLRTTVQELGYKVRIELLVRPDTKEVLGQMATLSPQICYDPTGDAELDGMRQLLSPEMISNQEKHREAWRRILATPREHPDDLFLVIEDDAFFLPKGTDHLRALLLGGIHQTPWDLLMLGICPQEGHAAAHDSDPSVSLTSFRPLGRVLVAKDSYLVKPETARRLSETCYEKIRFPVRLQLSSWLLQHPDVQVMVPNRPILMDGSKIGICPSSVHPSNLLVFNRDFVEIFTLLGQPPEVLREAYPRVMQTIKTMGNLRQHPDLLHILGVLQYKVGRIHEAEETLTEAALQMRAQQGLLNSRSEILNNLVQIYAFLQRDLPDLCRLKSRYDDPDRALAEVIPAVATPATPKASQAAASPSPITI